MLLRTLFVSSLLLLVACDPASAQPPRVVMDLNGTWEFDQTESAFPPSRFTRTIPVPGLIHLAQPRIDEYDVFFQRPDTVQSIVEHDLRNLDYTPRYSWYRRRVHIPEEYEGREAVLTILKSQYVTQVVVNGRDVGSSMACYTPIDLVVTSALRFGQENEILIRAGDRAWLPSEAAGGTDKEKIHYLPGIWDNVFIAFTGRLHIHRTLMLPSVVGGELTAKIKIRSLYPPQLLYGTSMYDTCTVRITVAEKSTGVQAAATSTIAVVRRDNITDIVVHIPLPRARRWSTDDPFLYTATVALFEKDQAHDRVTVNFGMRDFHREGKFFQLNGRKILLRGSNITLQRFFEDPECGALAWNQDWVRTLLADYPKRLHWNAMRLCVGIVPSFWYDIADSCGLLLQNEWFYWQNHGWDDQVRKEYTDWVWADGSHPSIAIWDAINENWDPFIGTVLIPELKKLDPTRVWDAGYMTAADMQHDEMDEPHPYRAAYQLMTVPDIGRYLSDHPFALGELGIPSEELRPALRSHSIQLVNEYGWIWLWRDGRPSKLTVKHYDYFAGKEATPAQRRELQAYWLQLETEWLRAERSLAGVLAFCYLTNNYGFTGDWFVGNIGDLQPGPTLLWFRHAFAPVAAFINLRDERYLKDPVTHAAGSRLAVNLLCVNDLGRDAAGTVTWRFIGGDGRESTPAKPVEVRITAYGMLVVPVELQLPHEAGGYLLLAELHQNGGPAAERTISRRYLRVGEGVRAWRFFDLDPGPW